MGERQTGLDLVHVGLVHELRGSQTTPPIGVLAGEQVALSGVLGEHLAARGDFEPLGDGLLGFDSLRTTHKLDLFDETKEQGAYGGWPSDQEVF